MEHSDKSQKRKPEEPSTEDTQQKKPKESDEESQEKEIKLALTKEGFSEDVRKALNALATRNVNRFALITQLWEFWNKCKKNGVYPETVASPDDGPGWVSHWLLHPLMEAKEEKEIAAVLAVCALVTDPSNGYSEAREMLITKGLAGPLAMIINSHLDQADIVERGLIVAADIAWANVNVANILTSLGFVSALEKIMESYSDNHDIMWRACDVCLALTVEGEDDETEAPDAIRESKIRELMEKARAAFPKGTSAYYSAKRALKHIDN